MRRFTLVALVGCLGCGLVYDYGDYAGTGSGGGPASGTASAGQPSSSTSTSTDATSSGGASTGDGGAATTGTDAGGGGDGPATSSSGGGGGSAPGCEELGSTCAPPAGAGWEGPVSVLVATSSNEDPPAMPDCDPNSRTVFEGRDDFLGGPASCECSCSASVECPAAQASVVVGDVPTCDVNPNCAAPWTLPPGVCTELPALVDGACGFNYRLAGVTVGEPTRVACSPSQRASVPPVGWKTAGLACSPTEEDAACPDAGVCIGAGQPELDRICVLRAGDWDCASEAPYSDRFTLFGSADDTRGCSPCFCEDSQEAQCNGLLRIFEGDTAGGGGCLRTFETTSTSVPSSDCMELATAPNGDVAAYGLYEPTPLLDCQAFPGNPSGAVEPGDETTLCCLPRQTP